LELRSKLIPFVNFFPFFREINMETVGSLRYNYYI
jgi:hypothetical protein